MKVLLISLILIAVGSPAVAQDAPLNDVQSGQHGLVDEAIYELELALDAFFELIDERSITRFTEVLLTAREDVCYSSNSSVTISTAGPLIWRTKPRCVFSSPLSLPMLNDL